MTIGVINTYVVPSAGTDNTTLTTPSFTPSAGEILVIELMTWDTANGMSAPTESSSTQTIQHIQTAAPGGFNGWAGTWVCKVTGSPGSITVSSAPATGANTRHLMVVKRLSGANLAATPATNATVNGSGSTTASTTLTTTAADSWISWCMVDENARDPASSTYISTSGTPTQDGLYDGHVGSNSVQYSVHQTAPTAGSNTFGLTNSIGNVTWVAVGVEILAEVATPVSGSDTGTGTDAVSDLTVIESSADTASGADAVAAFLGTPPSPADTSGSSEAESLAATLSSSEPVSGIEAAVVEASASAGDASTGADAVSAFAMETFDSGTSVDAGALSVTHSVTDSGTTTDVAALITALSNADSSAVVESTSVTVSITASDSAVATETSFVFDGSTVQRASTDGVSTVEGLSLSVQLSASDTATVAEVAGRDMTPAAVDNVSSAESAFVTIIQETARTVRPYPYYIRDTQGWAVEQERRRHNQALWQLGETTMFCLMWHIEDFQLGLVERCRTCFTSQGQITEVYGQSNQNKCLDCFGTTFDKGVKALIIRPAIFSDSDESETFHARGVIHPNDLSIESTPDFRIRTGDYCFRSTGDRYYLRVPERITLRTGYAEPSQSSSAIGYNHANAAVEDPASVAYLIPPAEDELSSILAAYSRVPRDWGSYEMIRAPLIPNEGV